MTESTRETFCHSLRLMSFNISMGFFHKFMFIVSLAISLQVNIICLQETGLDEHGPFPAELKPFVCFANGTNNSSATCAILVHNSLVHLVEDVHRDETGRSITLKFRSSVGVIFVTNVYMPSRLDKGRKQDVELGLRITKDILSRSRDFRKHFICGDFNETTSLGERVLIKDGDSPRKMTGNRTPKILPEFFQMGYVDCFAFFNYKISDRFTFQSKNRFGLSFSVLDRFLLSAGSKEIVSSFSVGECGGRCANLSELSQHTPVFLTLTAHYKYRKFRNSVGKRNE